MARFENKDNELFIDGKKVLKAWESYSGWYWFGTDIVEQDDNNTLWFGFVQGLEEEWGYFSEAELKPLIEKVKVWEIPKKNLAYSGRRG